MATVHTSKFIQKAPVELAGEFVSAVMRREYNDALVLCQALLMMEPQNDTYLEFEKVLKLIKERESDKSVIETDSDDGDHDDDDGDDDSDDDDSDDGLTDSSDSGNSDSSGDALDSDESDDDSSSDSSSDDDDDTSDNNNNSEADSIAKLNLLVGGLSVKKT